MASEPHLTKTLVLGLGNILLRDEGLGVRAVERLQVKYDLPENVQIVDGGVMGLDLLPYLEDADALLVVDAVRIGKQGASLVRLEGRDIPSALGLKMSIHQVGFQELLAIGQLRGTLPSRIVLWGIEPVSLKEGLDLSPEVRIQLNALVDAIACELEDWGIGIELKESC